MTNRLPPLPRDQRKLDADHLNRPAGFPFAGAGLECGDTSPLWFDATCRVRGKAQTCLRTPDFGIRPRGERKLDAEQLNRPPAFISAGPVWLPVV